MADQLDAVFSRRPTDFFPQIYAYSVNDPSMAGLLKIGYTKRQDAADRVKEQHNIEYPAGASPYKIVFTEEARFDDGLPFDDRAIHAELARRGIFPQKNRSGRNTEWFRCTEKDVRVAWLAVRRRETGESQRTESFSMRPEQEEAVLKTIAYYSSARADRPNVTPKFLWNAKMRFGKTFATYQLAKQCSMKKILVLTFKPAVQSAWEEDLESHVDFEGWVFIPNKTAAGSLAAEEMYVEASKANAPIVCFGSLQDVLGRNDNGGIKYKNEWMHTVNWDMVVFDEYHFGAWRDNTKNLFQEYDDEADSIVDPSEPEIGSGPDQSWLPITTDRYLYLSGTPFRALSSGEFIEEQIFNWTYSDEQRAKTNWIGSDPNPYEALPKMVMLAYKLPQEIRRIAEQGEFNEFDLNIFFEASGSGKLAAFRYEKYVQKWLDLIRGEGWASTVDELKDNKGRPAMPYSDGRLLDALVHTLWFLPNVAACNAMANLLHKPRNKYFADRYEVIVCAGTKAGIGLGALPPVRQAMGDPLRGKGTITLSCGKLTTGVTVPPWTGIFMLRNLRSPETYFQAAFRVQSPWVESDDDGKKIIMKKYCYVFDFAINRALRQIADYAAKLDMAGANIEQRVEELVGFLPVIAYDGRMEPIDAAGILDYAMSGTSSTLLAKRWESPTLVNVDNDTLLKLRENEDAMAALMNIEDFRSLNDDITTIINRSEEIKAAKKDTEKASKDEKKKIKDKEDEEKKGRALIRDKLIKLATRLPIFMYLTDFREVSMEDIICKLEPALFRKLTGIEIKDFELLSSIGVFNVNKMNESVWLFKRYEDSSLSYEGMTSLHDTEKMVGLYNTVISREEYTSTNEHLFAQALASSRSPLGYSSEAPVQQQEQNTPKTTIVKKLKSAVDVKNSPDRPTHRPVAPTLPPTPRDKLSGVIEGSIVRHAKHGIGKVEKISGSYITVDFKGSSFEFEYPGAFEMGFLALE